MAKRLTAKHHHEESSESENETEPAKIFHRRLSTNVKSSVSIALNSQPPDIKSIVNPQRAVCVHKTYRWAIKFRFDPDKCRQHVELLYLKHLLLYVYKIMSLHQQKFNVLVALKS